MRREWEFAPARTSPREARHQVSDALGSRADGEFGECIRLLVSELATNAVLHAGTPFSVSVALDDQQLRLEVRDGNRAQPHAGPIPTSTITGRGLALVEIYSDRWGTDVLPNGKIVWCEVDLPWKGVPSA
jgi:anti-sigma regulatory factor (Ser/Thr protein kinase)